MMNTISDSNTDHHVVVDHHRHTSDASDDVDRKNSTSTTPTTPIETTISSSLFIKPKLIYFSVASAYYGLYMFRGDLCKKYLNLKTDQFGTLSSIIAFVGFIFMPIWSSLADRLGRHRMIIIFLCLAMSASIQLAPLVKGIDQNGYKFVASVLFMSLYSLFSCGILPITDFIVLRMIEDKQGFSRDLYGRQRLWGTISYGITTLVVGFFSTHYGLVSLLYVLPLIVVATTFVLCFNAPPDSNALPFRSLFWKTRIISSDVGDVDDVSSNESINSNDSKNESINSNDSENNSKNNKESASVDESEKSISTDQKSSSKIRTRSPFRVLLTTPSYVFMLLVVFMTGSARAVMTTFLNVYWCEDLKFNATNRGWLATIGVIFEVIIFFNSQLLLRGLGIYWMFLIAQVATVLRCYAYYALPTSTSFVVFCGVELLKGVSFGFTQSAGVKLAGDVCPAGLESTAQAVYTAVYSQLPAVISAYCGGVVYQRFGADRLFLGISLISVVALLLCTLKYYYDGHILSSSSSSSDLAIGVELAEQQPPEMEDLKEKQEEEQEQEQEEKQ